MKFSNFLLSNITTNSSLLLMIGFTLYTFGIPIKYVILIALIALYGKYYLENKGIISTTKFDNVPYTNNNLNLIAKIKEFNAYSPPMVQSILNDYDQFFFIHNKIITDNTDFFKSIC